MRPSPTPPDGWTRAVVSGRTWDLREQLRLAGGIWDKKRKAWVFEAIGKIGRYEFEQIWSQITENPRIHVEFTVTAAEPVRQDDGDRWWEGFGQEEKPGSKPRPRQGSLTKYESWKDGD